MEDYLVHHGILGQKWGVRRYQNPDGTWTEAGKERYGKQVKGSKSNDHKSTNKKQNKVNENNGPKVFVNEEQLYDERMGKWSQKNTTVQNTNKSSNLSKQKLDDVEEYDYDDDIAFKINEQAAQFVYNCSRIGKEEAVKLLDDKLKDYTYEMIVTETNMIDEGYSFVGYSLKIIGDSMIYETGGEVYDDGDYYYDDDYFHKK